MKSIIAVGRVDTVAEDTREERAERADYEGAEESVWVSNVHRVPVR